MNRPSSLILAIVLCTELWSLPLQAEGNALPQAVAKKQVYDGKWWAAVEADERDGFLSGSADCLVYEVRAPWLSRSLEDLNNKIEQYYSQNPKDRSMPVTAVWRKLLSKPPSVEERRRERRGGEVWTNPHGFHNGFYYRQMSEPQRHGFLQGYISCLQTDVERPRERYLRSISYYAGKIWDYVDTHSKAYDEAIADILSRYRDPVK